MNLCDPENYKKYDFLKQIITPYSSNFTKKRYGGINDSSYVFLRELMDRTENIYSYGVGHSIASMAFDLECANNNKNVYLYDGSVEKLPIDHERFIFSKEFVNKDNFKNHLQKNGHGNNQEMILKMDIECNEYKVINENIDLISNHFNQIGIEVHSLIEEIPPGWDIGELPMSIKNNKQIKIDFFNNLSRHYNIVHIHGNNHGPIFCDFPDTLEITFLRKDYSVNGVETMAFPIPNLDFPNLSGKQDYVLDWWLKR